MSDASAITELDRFVAKVLAAAGSSGAAPVNVERVASLLGVQIESGAGGADGRLRLKDGHAVVEVSDRISEERWRFTAAHELGHVYLLHPCRRLPARIRRSWNDVELFCDDFATSLLMPRAWIEGQVGSAATELATLRHIARTARVSATLVGERLVRAGLWKSGLVQWHRTDGGWMLGASAGIYADLPKRLRLADETAEALEGLIARGPHGHVRMTIEAVLDDCDRCAVDAEVELWGDCAWTLVPVRFDGHRWEPRWRIDDAALDAGPSATA